MTVYTLKSDDTTCRVCGQTGATFRREVGQHECGECAFSRRARTRAFIEGRLCEKCNTIYRSFDAAVNCECTHWGTCQGSTTVVG